MKKASMFFAIALMVMSCNETAKKQESANSKSEEVAMEKKGSSSNEQDLFNGKDLEGWKTYNSEEAPTQWTVEDGILTFAPAEGERSGTENLISEEQFTNFELSLEWKISEGGNSGIMWGVKEGEQYSEPYQTGPEIQVLDNERHPDASNGPIRQAGALYDMVPPSEDASNPAGEWNKTVIRINYEENRGSVVLNGKQIVNFPLQGEEWNALKENSKFKDWEDLGNHKTGHIALQDHGDEVFFKNISIKRL